MTEPKFTPGPWKAHHGAYEPDYVFYGEEENCDTEKRVIAEVYQRVGFRSYDVDLIAAAPDMYAFVDLVKHVTDNPGLYAEACALIDRVNGESEVSE